MSNENTILCENLKMAYKDGKLFVPVLHGVNLQVQKGEQVAIVGASGSGKSTLLHLLGGLDKPTQGSVKINNTDIYHLSERARCKLRNQSLGFVYQLHHLLPEFSVLENTAMPLLLNQSVNKNQIEDRATCILDKVGLSHRLKHKLSELSGGERQRAAIARALVNEPSCFLADEPTGNLDHKTAMKVYELILELNQSLGTSIVIVTHDRALASHMDKIYELEDGLLKQIN